MSRTTLTDDDEGKEVRSADGELLGRVASVDGATAQIDAEDDGPSLSELGWANSEGESFPLDEDNVAEVTDETVRLAER